MQMRTPRVLGSVIATLAVTLTGCTPPAYEVVGTVTHYRAYSAIPGSGYFELEDQDGVYYCDREKVAACATIDNGDMKRIVYHMDGDWRIVDTVEYVR